jgi:Mg-chelatase subunit ChlD
LVIPFTLQLVQSEIIVDELTRNIFIPAAPFSDTGLVVTIDTAYINYSKVYFSFHCAMEETGQLIFNLHKNNIFLFENDVPVEEFTLEKDTSGGTNNTDIIFVLDVTGSMSNEIAGVRDNIIEFADSLSYKGINYRLGMVTFLDVIENIYDFTEDVQEFQMNVSAQYAHGGDDRPENSLDALSVAAQFSFRENASRIIIWITDADFHINDHITQQTKETVINQLLAMGITVNCIGDPLFQTDYYDQIVMNTGGGFFNINENFRDILLEVSRLNQATNHLVSFYHPGIIDPGDEFKIEVHYAGLGGKDSISFGSGLKSMSGFNGTEVIVYPNPFFHHPHLTITGSEFNTYRLEVYNIQGQLLNTKVINEKSQVIDIELSELLNQSDIGSNQIFFLKTITMSPKGDILNYETKKIKKF